MSRKIVFGWMVTGLAALLVFASCDSDDGDKGNPTPACEPSVEVPNLPLTWKAGQTYLVRWSAEDPCGARVRIELLHGGQVCATIADSVAAGGGHLWTCAACAGDSAGYTVRVTDLASGRADLSDADFTISAVQGDRVAWTDETSPGSLIAGSALALHWSSSGFAGDEVLIELLADGAVCDTIAAAAPNTGAYTWTVALPATPGEVYALRISDLTSGASAVTEWTFDILPGGSLAVSSPAGGETWLTGSTHSVAWSPAGASTDSVRIELLDDGGVCRLIAASAPGGGFYSWTVAGCPNGFCDYTVRVTRLASGASGASPASFCVVLAGLTLTAPDGGETWYEGETRAVTWQSAGSLGEELTLLLLRDGAVCDTIAAAAPTAAGSLDWNVAGCACPAPPCDSCAYSVRIVDPSLGIADASDAMFCLARPGLTVTAPAAGDVRNEGAADAITWTHSGPSGAAVRIELLLDGVVCATIADSTANEGTYAWTAAPCGADTSGYAVQVTDLDTGASDVSGGTFRIAPPTLALTSPDGGEEWIAGGNYTITWGRSGRFGDEVRIELLQAGEVCATIAAGTANDRSHTWTAAQCAGDSCAYRVRITDLETGLTDTSGATFCIRSYVFAVLAPVGGDRWHAGATQEISWTRAGTSGDFVRIELLHDGVACDTIAASAPNTRSFAWPAAACDEDTCGYTIRVTDTTTLSTALSAGEFCIPPSTLTVTTPADGDEWIAGTAHVIAWEQAGQVGDEVRIELLHDGEVCATIAPAAPNTGSYAWTAADCGSDTCGLGIRVTDLEAGTTGASAGAFCVLAPRLEVTEPDGGETWLEGSACSIAWAVTGTAGPSVRIELLRDDAPCDTIVAAAENLGVYAWIAEACTTATTGYRVRVTDPTTGAGDRSDATFTISPVLTVTGPDGGEEWIEGATQTVTWTHSHTHGDSVRIVLLRDGSPCDTLSAATPNDGAFGWPAARCAGETEGYTVRITDMTTGADGESDEEFTISPPNLTVLDPDGGEQWVEGASHTITWAAEGTTGDSVRIELLQAGAPVDTLSAGTPNDGSFPWAPTQHERHATGYRVRITDLTTGVNDASDATFGIRRDFRVTAPNGGEAWHLNSARTITWVHTASAGDSVRIELLCDGEPCDTLSAGSPTDIGSFAWTVTAPGEDSCAYAVRLTDLTTGDSDASNATFCVPAPELTVTSPDGGEIWDEGSTMPVTWTATAGIGDSVMIELLADGAVCDTVVAATPDDGTYDWVIGTCAGADSCSYAIRIRDLALDIADTSNARFCILDRSVSLTAPNGGEEWYTGATCTLTWTHAESAGDSVRLLLLRDGAVRDTIAASTANDDSVTWVAERFGGISVGYWITLTDLTTGDVDSTDGAIRINPGPTLASPDGGEAWVAGDVRAVTWTDPAPATDSMRLELLRDGELCDTLTNGTDNDDSFDWTLAQCGADTSGYRIRITNTETGGIDRSAATFRIFRDPTVTAPNGDEAWFVGDSHTVTWRASNQAGAQNVLIELRREGAPCDTLSAATANDGSFAWTAAQCDGEADEYAVRVKNLTTLQTDTGDEVFSIYVDPTVTDPNGGETLEDGEDYTITWRHATGSGAENVRIWLMREGATCDVVVASTANDGSYEWTFGQCAGEEDDYKILIRNLTTDDADSSDAVFSIE